MGSGRYRPSVVDIFCGCGGLSEGFEQAGYEVLLGIDCNKYAVDTYNRNHGHTGRVMNVEDVDSDYIFSETGRNEIDVLAGGPPCQAFSTVAVAKWRSLGMPATITHPMNGLYKEFLRLVLKISPKFFIIENVERMLTISAGEVRKSIESELKKKYTTSFYKKDAANFGIPQHRKRAIIIGNRMGLENPDIEETRSDYDTAKKPYITLREAISDLPSIKSGQGKEFVRYPQRRKISDYARERRKHGTGIYNHIARPHNERDLSIFSTLRPGQWMKHLPQYLNPYRKDIFADKYKKQRWNAPSSTIIAHMSKDGLMFIHPSKRQNRSLTPREAARLQSFDDTYVFCGPQLSHYAQIGNAVPPIFARSLAIAIKEKIIQPQASSLLMHNASLRSHRYH